MIPPTPAEVEAATERVRALAEGRVSSTKAYSGGMGAGCIRFVNVDEHDLHAVLDHVATLERRALAAEARASRYETKMRALRDSVASTHQSQVSAKFRSGIVDSISTALANDDGGDGE